MKNSDEAIKKVLAGLRNVDAPEGMQRRILNSLDESLDVLQDGDSGRSRSGWRQVIPIWLGMPAWPTAGGRVIWGIALGGAFVLAVAIPAMRRVGRVPVESKGSVAPVKSMKSLAPVEAVPRASSEEVVKSAQLFSTRPKVRTGPNVRSTGEVKAQRAAVVDDLDALALEEMRAASQPAPPLPLTKQERLLLRVAREGGPEELAALDPARRAAQDREERAEVERFFEPKTAEANE